MSRFGWAYVNDVITGSGGTTNPGGSDKQIQFNSGSTFSGSTNFTFDYTTNTVRLTGTLYADNLIVSSSTIFKSGSTKFGDDLTDTHQFTGSVSTNNNLTVIGQVSASVALNTAGTIQAGSNITSFGIISGSSFLSNGNITSNGIISSSGGLNTGGAIVASGSITSTGGILSSSTGVQTAGAITSQSIISSSLGFQTNSTITAVSNITSTSGLISASSGLYSGDVLSVAGVTNLKNNLIVTGSINVSGNISSSAQIQATSLKGDGLNITGVQATNVDGAGDDWAIQFKSGNTGRLTGSANLLFSGSTLTLTGSGIASFGTVSGSTISSSNYVGPIPKNAIFAANGVTTSSNYEVITINGNKYLQLQKRTTFPIARSIGASDSEYGWTWLNRANLSGSSNENTTVVSGANFVLAQAQTTWFPSTYTAPVRYRTYTLGAGQSMQVVSKIAATGSGNYEQVQNLIWTSGSNNLYLRMGVGYDLFVSGPRIVTQYTSNTNVLTPISASQILEGVWFAINITEDNFSSYYNLSTSSTPPSSGWVYNTGGSFITTTNFGRQLNVGQMIMSDHINPQTVTGSFKYFDVNITRNELAGFVNTSPYTQWPATQFDTSGTEQLIGEYDLGSSATVNQTVLRQLLADIENNQYLETATITWSAVQSDLSGASSGTFYSSNSVVISGSGRYFRLWVKITSNGNQAGSIGPFPIVIPIS